MIWVLFYLCGMMAKYEFNTNVAKKMIEELVVQRIITSVSDEVNEIEKNSMKSNVHIRGRYVQKHNMYSSYTVIFSRLTKSRLMQEYNIGRLRKLF